jgi:hypothetical protein
MRRVTLNLDIDGSCASVETAREPPLKGVPVMAGEPPNPN